MRFIVGALLLVASVGSGPAPAPAAAPRYSRALADYEAPDVQLIDAAGASVPLRSELARPGPVLLELMFTTCATVCPVATGTLAAAQDRLPGARILSISIDPEADTPARLRDYARRFGAGPRWRFLTGRADDVVAVERAFDAYRGDKMRHEALVFLHAAPGARWVRLEGFPSAADLAAEYGKLAEASGKVDDASQGRRRDSDDADQGRRLYRDGLLASGAPVRGVIGDVAAAGARLACAGCHRRSGFGGVEGRVFVPPVTGPALFGNRPPRLADRFAQLYQEELSDASWTRLRAGAGRPPYTEATLAAALRDGRDSAGRALDPLMPRYVLDDAEVASLARYLATLAAADAPGVDAERIHFATVIAPGVDAGRRRALLDVAEAFVRNKNADVRRLRERARAAPWSKDDPVATPREWVLHVWDLAGPADTWPEQLARRYREQPVFALLGGLGAGSWRPVHDFCEASELPCLFPETDRPVTEPPGAYSLYLSAGLAVEAEALARYLEDRARKAGAGTVRVLQVYRAGGEGSAPAAVLRRAMETSPHLRLAERPLASERPLSPADWAALVSGTAERPQALVLWLDGADLAALGLDRAPAPGAREVYLSASLLDGRSPALPPAWRERTYLTWRQALPGRLQPQAFRTRAWLRSRGVEPSISEPGRLETSHEDVQLDTYFVLSLADYALMHLVDSFSRDHLIEIVERAAERAANPGVYPRLQLGPGQRVASKGCYIVRLAAAAPGGVEPASGWIVP